MDDDVDATVLGFEVVGDPLRRVGRGDVDGDRGAADLADEPVEVGGERRDVEADDVGAVAGEDASDSAPIPREAPVTSATLPWSGCSQSSAGCASTA